MKLIAIFLACTLIITGSNTLYAQHESIVDGFVFSSANINGNTSPPSANLSASQSFSVSFQYRIWDDDNPNAIWYISVGIDTLPQVVAYNGIPGYYPGNSGTATVNLTAPSTSGTYQIRLCASPSVSQSQAFQNYRDVYRTLAYQAGAIGKISVGGSNTSMHPVFYSWAHQSSGTTSITFTTSYQLWDNSNPSAIWYIIAGLDSMPQQVVYTGIPGTAPGVTNTNVTRTLNNYGSQGVRQVYLWAIPAINQSTAFANYRSGWANGRSQAGSGDGLIVTAVQEKSSEIPLNISLSQNYPNPFNPTTTIEFSLPRSSYASLSVYNTLGEEVAKLMAQNLQAGSYKADWNAPNFPSGVYFYRFTADNFTSTKKLLLLK